MKSGGKTVDEIRPAGEYSGVASTGYAAQQVLGVIVVTALIVAAVWGAKMRWTREHCLKRAGVATVVMNNTCYVKIEDGHWEVAR